MNVYHPEIVLSLTSHPPRFNSLAQGLTSLLSQSVKPTITCLFVTEEHRRLLPRSVLALRSHGLSIVKCPDLGPYQKLIPSLTHFKKSLLVTADDDIIYENSWLESLLIGHSENTEAVICHRAHRLRRRGSDALEPYQAWARNVQDDESRYPSVDILPTGVGGVLYPPGCFDSKVLDSKTFMRLCPTGDDLWFYWMFRAAGTRAVKIGDPFRCNYIPGSQEVALWPDNRDFRNDEMIARLVENFGLPF